jgi:hypothetical protein
MAKVYVQEGQMETVVKVASMTDAPMGPLAMAYSSVLSVKVLDGPNNKKR